MSIRTAFMGSPEVAVPCLEVTARTTDLRLVVTQPDRPAGRGRRLSPPAVKVAAQTLGVPVFQPTKMRDGTLAARLSEEEPDLVVVVAFGRILPPDILAVPRWGCVNVHFSLLPRWRGAAPVQRAVLAGDRETGVSIMQLDEGLDTGPVFRQVATPIAPHETSGELFERLATLGAAALESFLGSIPPVPDTRPQDSAAATHAAMLAKDEGLIDWARPTAALVNHVRGMDPWPGAFTTRAGERLRVFRARAASDQGSAEPGTVLGLDGEGLVVATLDGALHVAELQPAGKRRMSASAYASGRPFAVAERLGD